VYKLICFVHLHSSKLSVVRCVDLDMSAVPVGVERLSSVAGLVK